jgi:peptidyl-prolyl cis-trans isomerase C
MEPPDWLPCRHYRRCDENQQATTTRARVSHSIVLGFLAWHFFTFLVDQSWRIRFMGKSWALCVLLGTLAWGQAAPSGPAAAQQAPPSVQDRSASVPDTAAVITVNGVCPPKPAAAKATIAKPPSAKSSQSTAPADCKTVLTKAQFEKLANSLAPNGSSNPQVKRTLETRLPTLIAISTQAKKQHMDQSEQYKETMKYLEMQVLASELQQKLQKEAADVPDADLQKYYDEHKADFEQFNIDRLFVPRNKQPEPELKNENEKNAKPTEEELKAKQSEERAKADESEQAMTKLADDLRARAAAGEDFSKLQKEAFAAAGMKIESPTVNLANIRRTGLAPSQASVFDLKPGEVSQVINDTGGHYVYKLNSTSEIPLDQAKSEIHGRLQSERMKDSMEKLNSSFKVETNEAYFGPAGPPPGVQQRPGPGTMGVGRGPRSGAVPPPSQQQAPPPPQDSVKH